jgi:hypothetical protein
MSCGSSWISTRDRAITCIDAGQTPQKRFWPTLADVRFCPLSGQRAARRHDITLTKSVPCTRVPRLLTMTTDESKLAKCRRRLDEFIGTYHAAFPLRPLLNDDEITRVHLVIIHNTWPDVFTGPAHKDDLGQPVDN